MWVQKSEQHIKKERFRCWFSFQGPIIWFVIIFTLLIASVFSPRNAEGLLPQNWYTFFFRACFIAAGVSLLAYVLQIILKEKITPFKMKGKTVICNNCHRVKNIDGIDKCECGGTFDDFDNWMWVDDPSDTESVPGCGRSASLENRVDGEANTAE